MGGVDLADTWKHNFNATHIRLDQWWLNLFFYLLDFGTPNTLLIYILSIKNESINISKCALIHVFISLSFYPSSMVTQNNQKWVVEFQHVKRAIWTLVSVPIATQFLLISHPFLVVSLTSFPNIRYHHRPLPFEFPPSLFPLPF